MHAALPAILEVSRSPAFPVLIFDFQSPAGSIPD
jgi:hypothetical protein